MRSVFVLLFREGWTNSRLGEMHEFGVLCKEIETNVYNIRHNGPNIPRTISMVAHDLQPTPAELARVHYIEHLAKSATLVVVCIVCVDLEFEFIDACKFIHRSNLHIG